MTVNSSNATILGKMSAFDPETKLLNVIIETPKGSRNKFNYDEKHNMFKLGGVLPRGAVFPFDFGFVPSTIGGDGDPLDVLPFLDDPAFAGCLVPAKVLGVIEAEQTEEDGKKTRNDRLVAVATGSREHAEIAALSDLSQTLVDEIEHFFVSYNAAKGKEFKPIGRFGAHRAEKLIKEGIQRAKRAKGSNAKRPGKATKPKK